MIKKICDKEESAKEPKIESLIDTKVCAVCGTFFESPHPNSKVCGNEHCVHVWSKILHLKNEARKDGRAEFTYINDTENGEKAYRAYSKAYFYKEEIEDYNYYKKDRLSNRAVLDKLIEKAKAKGEYGRICAHCGKRFIPNSMNHIYCCYECSTEELQARRKYPTIIYDIKKIQNVERVRSCAFCGKLYELGSEETEYCCASCIEAAMNFIEIPEGENGVWSKDLAKSKNDPYTVDIKAYEEYKSHENDRKNGKVKLKALIEIKKITLDMDNYSWSTDHLALHALPNPSEYSGEPGEINKVCPVCGIIFQTNNNKRIFCSEKCWRINHKINVEMPRERRSKKIYIEKLRRRFLKIYEIDKDTETLEQWKKDSKEKVKEDVAKNEELIKDKYRREVDFYESHKPVVQDNIRKLRMIKWQGRGFDEVLRNNDGSIKIENLSKVRVCGVCGAVYVGNKYCSNKCTEIGRQIEYINKHIEKEKKMTIELVGGYCKDPDMVKLKAERVVEDMKKYYYEWHGEAMDFYENHRQIVKKNLKELSKIIKMNKRVCEVCGKEFIPLIKNQRCCSYKCQEHIETYCFKEEVNATICPICGGEIENVSDEYCSDDCKEVFNKMRRESWKKKEKRICAYCGKEFTPKTLAMKYCCPDCGTKGNEERHNKIVQILSTKFKYEDELEETLKPSICTVCGGEFTPKVQNQRCCSRECRDKFWAKENLESNNTELVESTKLKEENTITIPSTNILTKKCAFCGKEFTMSAHNQKYCSEECYSASHDLSTPWHNNHWARSKTIAKVKKAINTPKEATWVTCISQEKVKKEELEERICPVCGKSFKPNHKYHIYCSVSCKKQADLQKEVGEEVQILKEEPKLILKEVRECELCGKEFTPKVDNQKYCSKECSKRMNKIRARERGRIREEYRIREKIKEEGRAKEERQVSKKMSFFNKIKMFFSKPEEIKDGPKFKEDAKEEIKRELSMYD